MKRILVLTTLILMMLGTTLQADTITLGSNADTYLRAGYGPFGNVTYMYTHGSYNFAGYLRFDLSSLGAIEITDVSLILTKDATAPRADSLTTGRFALHGLKNVTGNTPQDWNESTLTSNLAGQEWDVDSTMAASLADGRVVNLDAGDAGVNTTETITESASVMTVTGADMVSFLQNRVYNGGLATFIVTFGSTEARGIGYSTKEHATVSVRPALHLTYTPIREAYLPSPADKTTVPYYITELAWRNPDPNNPGDTITSDVYLGTDPNNMTKIADDTLLETAAIPFPLTAPAKYYWRVDCTDPNSGLSIGPLWSFNTSAAPELSASPANAAVFEGQGAAFAARFTSTSAIVSNKWYKAGAPDAEVVPGANAVIALTYDSVNDIYTSTLTLSNLTAAADGQYYCALTNSGGTTNSASAKLIIKRLIAYWPFDGDAADTTGVYNGTLMGTPVFEPAGKVGQALIFDGVDDYVDLPDGFSDFSAGMSIAVWAYPTAVNNWARFIDFASAAEGPDDILFGRNAGTNTLRFDFAPWPGAVDATEALALNTWQMFVVSMNETGTVVLYKNGLPVATGTVAYLPNVVTRTSNFIGESNYATDAMYAGMMDDMRIYNYGITADQVADLYSGVVGPYCRSRPTYDFDGNCLVSLEDFVYLAGYWLDCGFYPVTDCQ
jgi:hypothetical protein